MVKVTAIIGFYLGILSFGVCFCQSQLRTLDNARVDAIDDKVRVSLNATLSDEAVAVEASLKSAIDSFDAQCNQDVEELGAECVACATTACGSSGGEENTNKFKLLVAKLKGGIKKFTRKVKEKVKKFARKIGRTVRKVWRGITRGVTRVIRRTIRGITRKVRRALSGTIRRIGRAIRRVGSAIRRVGRAIRRAVRIRIRFRRWGKRNEEALPDCALSCEACRTLQSADTEQICGRNHAAEKLFARLNLIETALNATHDGTVPLISKIEFNSQSSFWLNNDMLFNETYVTSNVLGAARRFLSPHPLPMFGDATAFANSLAAEIWKLYQVFSQAV